MGAVQLGAVEAREARNFQKENARKVIKAKPVNVMQGEAPPKPKDFGKVPKYLQQRQAELEVFRREQERARAEAEAHERKRKADEKAQAANQRRAAARRRLLQADTALEGGEACDEVGRGAWAGPDGADGGGA